ncbi:MAG: phosphonate ABC transporter, permease protein PhnE [Halobacteriales archaeon]
MSSGSEDRNELAAYLGLQGIGDAPVEEKLTDLKLRKTKARLKTLVGTLIGGAVFLVSLDAVGFSLSELVKQWPEFVEALGDYFPATTYFGVVPFVDVGQYWAFMLEAQLFQASLVTLSIAFAGTVLGVLPAVFFSVMASERVVPYPFNFLFRAVMSMIRSIPALVWVLILIPLGGVGPFTATLAVGIDTVGYLGRLLTDELEEISEGPIEGIRSVGASKSQIVSFGMLSQVFREFIAWLAFDLEHNVRVAIGLGIIGAGGLGLELNIQRRTFNYTEMMACIILVLLLVGSVEYLSQRVRSYLREGEDVETQGPITILLNAPRKIVSATAGRRE